MSEVKQKGLTQQTWKSIGRVPTIASIPSALSTHNHTSININYTPISWDAVSIRPLSTPTPVTLWNPFPTLLSLRHHHTNATIKQSKAKHTAIYRPPNSKEHTTSTYNLQQIKIATNNVHRTEQISYISDIDPFNTALCAVYSMLALPCMCLRVWQW